MRRASRATGRRWLLAEQREFFRLVSRPLKKGDQMVPHNDVAFLIKPNDRLTSHERLALYARQYWWRLLHSLQSDFPKLQSLLGEKTFRTLVERYLTAHPSKSFTLRNVGAHLPKYLLRAHRSLGTKTRLASDVAAVEWALIECFDAGDIEALSIAQVGSALTSLRLRLRPSVRLLEVRYPVWKLFEQQYVREGRGDASNVLAMNRQVPSSRAVRRPRMAPQTEYLIVHRHAESVYIKSVSKQEYLVLKHFADGATLPTVLRRSAAALKGCDEESIRALFARIVSLQLLCVVEK